jgi:chemotaxis protein MotB
MDESKLLRVVGLASAQLYDKDNPYNPTNRRISLVVMNKQAEEDALKDAETEKAEASALAAEISAPAASNPTAAPPTTAAGH